MSRAHSTPQQAGQRGCLALSGLLAILIAAEVCELWPAPLRVLGSTAILFAATVATLVGLLRELPVQNVLFLFSSITTSGVLLTLSDRLSGLPLDSVSTAWKEIWEAPLRRALPFCLLWSVGVLNARRAAQWALAGRRASTNYGLLVIGLAAALTAAFVFGTVQLQEIASTHAAGDLIKKTAASLPSAALPSVISGILAGLLLTAFAPWFIVKKPAGGTEARDPGWLWGCDRGTAEASVWFLLICGLTAVQAANYRWGVALLIGVAGIGLPVALAWSTSLAQPLRSDLW